MRRPLLRHRFLAAGLGTAVLFGVPSGALAEVTEPAPRPLDLAAADPAPATAPRTAVGPVTGFPLPRFVSLAASEANARRGPSRSHRIDWVFTRRNMPLMVVAEHGNWRRVVDIDGVGGWMHSALLSGVRTVIVTGDGVRLHSRPDPNSLVRAEVERGVVARTRECNGAWCLLDVGGYRGWVPGDTLWGVTPGEVFD